MLKSLNLLPVYDSAEHDLVRDLQVPLLQESIEYLRGVGFFASGWLRIASRGLVDFVQRGGKARIVISPILDEHDWEAIQIGEEARFDSSLKALLARKVDDLRVSLEEDTRNAFAWMIADGVIDMRFAIPRELSVNRYYHDKVGIFKDEKNDVVVLHGSLNDSIQGSLNGEAFSVFTSWGDGQQPYLNKHVTRLEALWDDRNSHFSIYKIPDAIREQIIQLRTTISRPYSIPHTPIVIDSHKGPHCSVSLYTFQYDAIKQWKEAGYCGIFEMATGTGKTITSLAAAVEIYNKLNKLVLIVIVPYLHLLEQWERNCRMFGFIPILCSSNHGKWQIKVKSQIQDFNIGACSSICILSVHKTAASQKFCDAIMRLKPEYTLIIGDEAHGLGSQHLRNALTKKAEKRLGLSATPSRWYDDEGTDVIYSYFGKTCFEYSLDDAIGKYLTPYRYCPQLVNLSDDETEQYERLTTGIRTMALIAKHDHETREKLKNLLLARARIISSAKEKLPVLLGLLRSLMENNQRNGLKTRDILIYCAPGSHREVLQAVARLGLRCHEFVHDVSLSDREKLLGQFANGDIQVLVAIKCLDEGVDVPSTRIAFILASSTNPREFVQRRGRILRQAEGKNEAIIYDFIVVPSQNRWPLKNETDICILKREMPRFVEFASSAKNQFQARSTIHDMLNRYEMLNLLDEKPWDVYHNLKQWDWSNDEED